MLFRMEELEDQPGKLRVTRVDSENGDNGANPQHDPEELRYYYDEGVMTDAVLAVLDARSHKLVPEPELYINLPLAARKPMKEYFGGVKKFTESRPSIFQFAKIYNMGGLAKDPKGSELHVQRKEWVFGGTKKRYTKAMDSSPPPLEDSEEA